MRRSAVLTWTSLTIILFPGWPHLPRAAETAGERTPSSSSLAYTHVVVTAQADRPYFRILPLTTYPTFAHDGMVIHRDELRAVKESYATESPSCETLLTFFTEGSTIPNYDFLLPRLIEVGVRELHFSVIGVRDVCDNREVVFNLARRRFFSSDFPVWFDAWARIDPENAMPYYLYAAWLVWDARNRHSPVDASDIFWILTWGNSKKFAKVRDVRARLTQEADDLLDKYEKLQVRVQSDVLVHSDVVAQIGNLVDLPQVTGQKEAQLPLERQLLLAGLAAFDGVCTMEHISTNNFVTGVTRSVVFLKNAASAKFDRGVRAEYEGLVAERDRVPVDAVLARSRKGGDFEQNGELRVFQEQLLSNTGKFRRLLSAAPTDGK